MSNENQEDMMVLMRVATVAATAHQNQNRKNGGNYVRHPIAVSAF